MIFKSKDEFLNKLNQLGEFKVLAIDYGRKKSGLAIYNSTIKIVTPLKIFHNIYQNIDKLITIIEGKSINALVIGKPVKLDYSSATLTNEVEKFTQSLSDLTNLPIILIDERFTTSLANTLLKEVDIKRKKRNEIDDIVSASLILEELFY